MKPLRICILPSEQIVNSDVDIPDFISKIPDKGTTNLENLIQSDYSFFKTGHDAISELMLHLKLRKNDEVYITTTKETSYVSTCVSATIFNHCKISRVLTEYTKAIFVIHTFCFPHPQINELRILANDLKIPLIEDCISSFQSYNNKNQRLGSIGDYAIYSLPKIFPIEYGGILSFKSSPIKGIKDDYLKDKLSFWLPKLWYLKEKRVANYNYLFQHIGNNIYGEIKNQEPFMFGFISDDYQSILNKVSFLEEGKSHVKKEIHIPVNPFIDKNQYELIFNLIK